MKYPAIHEGASHSSDHSQKRFNSLILAEYGLLFGVSIALWIGSGTKLVDIAVLIAIILAVAISWHRASKKPDEDWYQFRALAESAKTLTWRFAMRSDPFDQDNAAARATLRNRLKELVRVNATLGARLEPHSADADQITDDMEAVRNSSLDERKETYRTDRIQDQRSWYAKKAALNKRLSRNWSVALIVTYVLLLLVLTLRIAYPTLSVISPDPFLVLSASVIGWMQVKKFNDLAASYFLTAQEIGIAATELTDIKSETDLARFVNSAELAFSREQTQWVARRRE